MPHHSGSDGRHVTSRQKGKPGGRRSYQAGTYSRTKKSAKADRYDRPFIEGRYLKIEDGGVIPKPRQRPREESYSRTRK